MIEKQDDLTEIPHIGITRMKLLNDSGITSIKQLHELSLEKLGEIKWIGEHSAKLIQIYEVKMCKRGENVGAGLFIHRISINKAELYIPQHGLH